MENLGIKAFHLNEGATPVFGKRLFTKKKHSDWGFKSAAGGIWLEHPTGRTVLFPWTSISWVETEAIVAPAPKKRRARKAKPKVAVVEPVEAE
tara:strand:+ start:246 stop:524 length:279 start_codon:yes stop_codon:yes gene_type:complete